MTTTVSKTVAGVDRGQRQLNGPQTTGREYPNLSQPLYARVREDDISVPMRDGTPLLADVHRPDAPGRFPVLVAASPYPRQIQDLGAPMGFIEAGASDYFVPRGYVHLIANLRGTGGSGGTFGFFDEQERLHVRPGRVGSTAALVGRQRRHDRDQLLRDDPTGSRHAATTAPQSDFSNRGNPGPL